MTGLKLLNVSSGYKKTSVIHHCSFEVNDKETLVLMGPSGSGKSTLLLTILGYLTPTSGSIFLEEQDISELPMEKRNIGYLPQDFGLFPHLNVVENVSFGLRVRGISKAEQLATSKEMLDLLKLRGFENRSIRELSGGEKQRVALARALATRPKLLLLDEPLSSIDQVTKKDVAIDLKALFYKLDIPIILVTHNVEDAKFLAQTLAIMIDGSIKQKGTLSDVQEHPASEFIKRLVHPFA